MKRYSYLILVFAAVLLGMSLTAPPPVLAAEAGNVQVRMEGSRVALTFDIPGEQPVDVKVEFLDDRGPLKISDGTVSGDVGRAIPPGKGKTVYWEFLKDYPYGLGTRVLKARVTLTGAEDRENTPPAKGEKMTKIRIETSQGDIVAELDAQKAPVTVQNILDYVRAGFYDGTIFHRVIDGFMIQGGGFDENMNQKETRPPIKNEAGNGLKNARGTLAMARTSVVDSATAQFFINLVDNGFLDHKNETPGGYGYAVFGKVVEGMDVVDRIGKVETGNSGGFQDVPREKVVLVKVTVVE